MTNKTDYTALVNLNLASGVNIPASDHRATMHTETASIGEVVFGAGVTDKDIDENYTTSNANFSYTIFFRKVGSQVTLTGRFQAEADLSNDSFEIFEVTDSDLIQESSVTAYFNAIKPNNSDTLPVYFLDSKLITNSSILDGESYRFTITYNTAD